MKNMLQASTQSIQLSSQIAENAQQLTRENSTTIPEIELKASKDPHENELLQAVSNLVLLLYFVFYYIFL